DRQRELANDILKSPGAPPGVRSLAEHLIKGTKPYEVGKRLDIKFTALDGREVDLAKLKGKVVLIEFWSTSCGPCVAEMPEVKATYRKFHDRGFEVVGVSLDDKESELRRFIREKDLPWPQHFDGKGWENKFALRYGIFAIPTMWLVDQSGKLFSTEGRFDLERQVASLLGERSAISK
ncbi:MAG: TlpA family protein disulfide reductase, partial [Limisphaerales bacterium]